MIFSNSKKILFLLALLSAFPLYPVTEQNPDLQLLTQAAEQRQDMIEHILKMIVKQLNDMAVMLEDYALDVANNVVKTVKNKPLEIAHIKKMRQLVDSLQNDAYTHIDEYGLLFLLQLNKDLLDYLKESLQKGFVAAGEFKIDQTRPFPIEEISYEVIEKQLNETNAKLEALTVVAKNAGLAWYNKAYRKIDAFIDKSKKYKVPQIAAIAALSGAVGFTLLFHSQWDNPTFRKIFGYPPHILNGTTLDQDFHTGISQEKIDTLVTAIKANAENNENIKPLIDKIVSKSKPHPMKWWLGEPEYFFYKYTHGYMPLVSLVGPIVAVAYKDSFLAAKDYLSKKVTKFTNFLKGGEYRNRPDGISELKSSIVFDDLVGFEHAKNIGRKILKYIEDPERFARKNLVPERGYILYGKSRTGKSEFAKAFCGEIQQLMKAMGKPVDDYSFYEIKTSIVMKEGIGYIYALAKEAAPCVLFIDEIDMLGLQRAGGNREVLSEFLSTLSGFVDSDPKKQVIILAATNKPENLDFALRQRGRFGKAIYFDVPGLDNRREFLMKRLNGLSVDLAHFDIEKLALETDGCTYEELNAMIKAAFQRAKTLGVTLTQEQLEFSLDEEVRNLIFIDDKTIPNHEQKIIATHQLGKAMAHLLLPSDEQVAKVTILSMVNKLKEENPWDQFNKDDKSQLYNPVQNMVSGTQKPIDYGRIFTYKTHDTLKLPTKEQRIIQCKIHLAGIAAQQALLGTSSNSYHPEERQMAFEIAKSIVFDGIDPQQLAKDSKNKLLDEAFNLVLNCEKEMSQLFKEHKEILATLVDELIVAKSLTGQHLKEKLSITTAADSVTAQEMERALQLQEVIQ